MEILFKIIFICINFFMFYDVLMQWFYTKACFYEFSCHVHDIIHSI